MISNVQLPISLIFTKNFTLRPSFIYSQHKKQYAMEIAQDIAVIELLIANWEKQQIPVIDNSIEKIERIEMEKSFQLPYDFKEFYSMVNGMQLSYPGTMDQNGFLFYPVEAIEKASSNSSILVFAEYMHKAWVYGVQVNEFGDYTIGILTDDNTYRPITNSLGEFIEFYLTDSPKLYDFFVLYSKYPDHMINMK